MEGVKKKNVLAKTKIWTKERLDSSQRFMKPGRDIPWFPLFFSYLMTKLQKFCGMFLLGFLRKLL